MNSMYTMLTTVSVTVVGLLSLASCNDANGHSSTPDGTSIKMLATLPEQQSIQYSTTTVLKFHADGKKGKKKISYDAIWGPYPPGEKTTATATLHFGNPNSQTSPSEEPIWETDSGFMYGIGIGWLPVGYTKRIGAVAQGSVMIVWAQKDTDLIFLFESENHPTKAYAALRPKDPTTGVTFIPLYYIEVSHTATTIPPAKKTPWPNLPSNPSNEDKEIHKFLEYVVNLASQNGLDKPTF